MFKPNRYEIGTFLFKCAMLFAFLLSLNPYFFWSLGNYGYIVCVILIIVSSIFSKKIYSQGKKFLPAIALLLLIHIYMRIVNGANIFGYIFLFIDWYILSHLFKVDDVVKTQTIIFIARILAIICLISLIGFVLFIFGIYIPPYNVDFNDGQYEYLNYTLFLLNYKHLAVDIPRFNGIFLEPAHIGVASTMLLTALSFDFSKWYNKILLVIVFATFSLASYCLLVFGLFMKYRARATKTFKYIFLFIGMLVISYFVAVNYNDGDNMVNNLIVERLQFEDGEMAGNNRVSDSFKADYEKFLMTDKIWFGSKYEPDLYEGGNAGYRVYIYEYGFIGLIMITSFYLLCMKGYPLKSSLPLFIMYVMIFWKGGTPLWYNLIIPYICGLSILSNNIKCKK